MLRLFVNLKDQYLKVRCAFPQESMPSSFTWKGELEIQYLHDSMYMMSWTSLLPDLEPPKARALVDFVAARYPVSGSFSSLKEACPQVVFQSHPSEWIFYGGSFNPWHRGHQSCLDLLPPEKTCFVLPDINPHKEMRSFELVSSVIELSAKARFHPNQFLVPSFLLGNAKNPTINWIERLHREFPDHQFSLLIGFDSFAGILNWTRGPDLLQKLHCLYVVSRLESDAEREVITEKIHQTAPKLKIEMLGRHGFEQLSSSELRRL